MCSTTGAGVDLDPYDVDLPSEHSWFSLVALSHETHDGIAMATIDHPPSNLVDVPSSSPCWTCWPALEPDDAVRVLILRGADPDFFLMHGDVEILRISPRWRRGIRTERGGGDLQPVCAPDVS